MKISDIFNQLIGKDPEKDYDFDLKENVSGSAAEPVVQTTEQNPTSAVIENMPQNTVESEQIKQLQAEVANLKGINAVLLSQASIPNKEKSDIELIYEICGKKGGNKKNGQ